MLGSAGVTEVDNAYNTSVEQLLEVDNQEEDVMRQVAQKSEARVVSPEPSKRLVVTSTPHSRSAPPMSPQAITRIRRSISFRMGGITDENALSEGETLHLPPSTSTIQIKCQSS